MCMIVRILFPVSCQLHGDKLNVINYMYLELLYYALWLKKKNLCHSLNQSYARTKRLDYKSFTSVAQFTCIFFKFSLVYFIVYQKLGLGFATQ